MTDDKRSKNRRKLLKSIAAGSGVVIAGKSLPEKWSRPAIDAVLLPAHAQTSQQLFLAISTAAPFGSNSLPATPVDDTVLVNLSWKVTANPAPPAIDSNYVIELYLDGTLVATNNRTLGPDGTDSDTGFANGITGVGEFRFIWGTQVTSLFWDFFTTGGTSAPASIGISST